MTDSMMQFAVGNLCVSLVAAVVAWAAHATGKRPLVAHLLWLLVLAQLVTPPIVTVPVVAVPGLAATTTETLNNVTSVEATTTSMLLPGPDGSGMTSDRGTTGPFLIFAASWFVRDSGTAPSRVVLVGLLLHDSHNAHVRR